MKTRSRRSREVRENLKRAGVWIFLVIFTASVLGVAVVSLSR